MPIDVTEMIQGPASIWVATFGATEPAETAVALAADPSAPWVHVGLTEDGTTISINQDFSELEADQIVDVAGRRLVKRDVQISTQLAQPTLENLTAVMNAGTVDSSITGIKKLVPLDGTSATQPAYRALIIDGFAPGQLRRRIIVRKVLSTDNAEMSYKKDAKTLYPVTWSAHYVSPSIKPFVILDEDPA